MIESLIEVVDPYTDEGKQTIHDQSPSSFKSYRHSTLSAPFGLFIRKIFPPPRLIFLRSNFVLYDVQPFLILRSVTWTYENSDSCFETWIEIHIQACD